MPNYIIISCCALMTISANLSVGSVIGFDEEDVAEFCKKQGRNPVPANNGLFNLLRPLDPTEMRPMADPVLHKLVEDVLQGCAAEKGKSVAENDMDQEFMRLSDVITNALVAQNTREDMEKLAQLFKSDARVSYRLFWYSMVRAVHRRKEFEGLNIPNAAEYLPEMFLPIGTSKNAMRLEETDMLHCFLMDEECGLKNGDENILFYFRENIDLNSHHQYWHMLHGREDKRLCTVNDTLDATCHEDRRGELFHYMHKALLSMYHTARLSTCLPEIEEFSLQMGAVIDQGYVPLVRLRLNPTDGEFWGERKPFQQIPAAVDYYFTEDGKCHNIYFDLKTQLLHWQRVRQAISDGFYQTKENGTKPLSYDILGDILESSDNSPNREYYGLPHNIGHLFLERAVTDTRLFGLMGDTATAMRDPVFYRWHLFVNNVFDAHQRSLPPYEVRGGELPLQWDGVEVEKIELQETKKYSKVNELNTFFRKQQIRIPIPATNSSVINTRRICFKGLEHRDFDYNIWVNNKGSKAVQGTVRLFMAVNRNPDGNTTISLLKQRKYIFPLDIYNVNIPPGKSKLPARPSVDSTVTTARVIGGELTNASIFTCEEHRCGCGIPHNLLIPRGKANGMHFDVVAIITDRSKYDWTHSPEDDKRAKCKLAPVVCSLPRFGARKYPDLDLPMGYPFDRLPFMIPKDAPLHEQKHVDAMDEFVEAVGNMGLAKVRVTHHNLYVKNQDWKNPKQTKPAKTKQINTLCRGQNA